MEKMEPDPTESSKGSRFAGLLIAVSFTLNLPALVIWTAALLRRAGLVAGETLALWLRSQFSEMALLGMWLMLPSSALIFALGGYAMNGKRWVSLGAVALSSVLLLALVYWANALR